MSACSATKHSSSITLQKVYVGVSFRKETGTITETLTNLPLRHVKCQTTVSLSQNKKMFSLFSNSFEINQTDSAPKKRAHTLWTHQFMRALHNAEADGLATLWFSPSPRPLPPFSLRPAAMCATSRRSSTPSLSATCRSMWTRSSGCSRSAAASATTPAWRRPTWRTTLVPDTQVRTESPVFGWLTVEPPAKASGPFVCRSSVWTFVLYSD